MRDYGPVVRQERQYGHRARLELSGLRKTWKLGKYGIPEIDGESAIFDLQNINNWSFSRYILQSAQLCTSQFGFTNLSLF